jgi:hypothetical protein
MARTRRRIARSVRARRAPSATPFGVPPLALAAGAGLVVYLVGRKLFAAAATPAMPTLPAPATRPVTPTPTPTPTPRPVTPPATGGITGTILPPCNATLRTATYLRPTESAAAVGTQMPAGTALELLAKSTTVPPSSSGSSFYRVRTAAGALGWAYVARAEITSCLDNW